MSYKILVVDDNPVDLECTRLVLEKSSDFEITGFIDPSSALNEVCLNPNKYTAILLDYQMPVKNVIEVAQEMLSINPHLVIALNSAVNMSSITETLFESEIFGHEKGAFTGAVSDKKGTPVGAMTQPHC